MRHDKVLRLRDGRFVHYMPPVGGVERLRPFRYWSPIDWTLWAYSRIATPLHFYRIRRWLAQQEKCAS